MYKSYYNLLKYHRHNLAKFHYPKPHTIKVFIPNIFPEIYGSCYCNYRSRFDSQDEKVLTEAITAEVYWKKPHLEVYLFPNLADPYDEIGPNVRSYGIKLDG